MRDVLNDLESGKAAFDPVRQAQQAMKPVLPKRFYKTAEAVETDGGFAVHLDGRTARTPARNRLVLPTFDLARRVAAEWAAQEDRINPALMPVTRIVNPAIDSVGGLMEEVRADIAAYAGSDLLCYRAEEPEKLMLRQAAAWDPVIACIEAATGGRFVLAAGIVHQAQPAAALTSFATLLEQVTPDPFTLAATHVMTSLTGSALLAASVAADFLDAAVAWDAAHVDEDWTNEHWGVDAEAALRRSARRVEFMAAADVVELVRA